MNKNRLLFATLLMATLTTATASNIPTPNMPQEATSTDDAVSTDRIDKAVEEANNQLAATNYDGRTAFVEALQKVEAMKAAATTADEVQKVVDYIHEAQATYLKNRPSEWITIQNGNMWTLEDGRTTVASGSWLLYDTEVNFDPCYARYFRIIAKDENKATIPGHGVLMVRLSKKK